MVVKIIKVPYDYRDVHYPPEHEEPKTAAGKPSEHNVIEDVAVLASVLSNKEKQDHERADRVQENEVVEEVSEEEFEGDLNLVELPFFVVVLVRGVPIVFEGLFIIVLVFSEECPVFLDRLATSTPWTFIRFAGGS